MRDCSHFGALLVSALVKKAPKRAPKDKAAFVPRKAPRQERAQATVDAILTACARILREQGYEGLTTNKVADAAGVSVGSLYQYFPGKDALVAATMLSFSERQQKYLFAAMASVGNEPIARVIETVVRTLMEMSEADPELSMVLMNQIPRVGEIGEVVAYFQETVTGPIQAFLEARKDDIDVDNPRAAAFVLSHTIQPLLQRVHFSGLSKTERAQIFGELTRMITGYLLGRKSGRGF